MVRLKTSEVLLVTVALPNSYRTHLSAPIPLWVPLHIRLQHYYSTTLPSYIKSLPSKTTTTQDSIVVLVNGTGCSQENDHLNEHEGDGGQDKE